MSDPPTVHDIAIERDWLPVRIRERHETRREHAILAGLALIAVAGLLIVPFEEVAVVCAFVAGYAFNNWLVFDDCYGRAEE